MHAADKCLKCTIFPLQTGKLEEIVDGIPFCNMVDFLRRAQPSVHTLSKLRLTQFQQACVSCVYARTSTIKIRKCACGTGRDGSVHDLTTTHIGALCLRKFDTNTYMYPIVCYFISTLSSLTRPSTWPQYMSVWALRRRMSKSADATSNVCLR